MANPHWQSQSSVWLNRQVERLFSKGLGRPRGKKDFCKSVQMVFQDPAESLNTRMTVGSIVREPLDIHNIGAKNERHIKVEELLEKVGLPESSVKIYPFEFQEGSVKESELPVHSLLSLNYSFWMNRCLHLMFLCKVRSLIF